MNENQAGTTDSAGIPAGDPNPDDLGAAQTPQQQPAPSGDAVNWEAKYRDLEKDYTRKSQKLSRLERESAAPHPTTTQSTANNASPEDFDWANPGASIGKYVGRALSDFEARQQQQRAAERYLEQFAQDNQIPVRDLYDLHQQVADASRNPEDLMNLLADVYKARHASSEVQRAQQLAEEAARKNARAVTTQGGAAPPAPPGFSIEDFKTWPREKREAYLRQNVGIVDD